MDTDFIKGIIPPIVTPFTDDERLDETALRRHIDFMIDGGISGILAFAVAVFCLQGKMGLVPFDLAEAETELAAGSQIEYSGPLLALWKLSRMMLLVIGPLFLVLAFWPGTNVFFMILKYAVVFVAAVLLRNTNPRLRIDQTMKLFWGPVTALSIIVLFLALQGL